MGARAGSTRAGLGDRSSGFSFKPCIPLFPLPVLFVISEHTSRSLTFHREVLFFPLRRVTGMVWLRKGNCIRAVCSRLQREMMKAAAQGTRVRAAVTRVWTASRRAVARAMELSTMACEGGATRADAWNMSATSES